MSKLMQVLMIWSMVLVVSAHAIDVQVWEDTATSSVTEAADIVAGGEPTRVTPIDTMEWPNQGINNYVSYTEGFFVPQESGDYTLYLYSDDDVIFSLAPDDDPAKVAPLLSVSGWTGFQGWGEQESATSGLVSLEAGQLYAFTLLHREGGGGDFWGIGMTLGGPDFNNVTVISGDMIVAENPVPKAANPSPAHNGTGIVDADLSWTGAEGAIYTVYFGMAPEALNLLTQTQDTTVNAGSMLAARGGLLPEADYYWRVDSQIGDDVIEGHVWKFTTQHNRPLIVSVAGDFGRVGDAASLTAETTDVFGLDITHQWFMASNDPNVADVAVSEPNANPNLDIPALVLEDKGVYYVVATNDNGSTASDKVILDVQLGLIHRYSFNDGTAADSVGGADGVLVNGTGNSTIADGQLLLNNSTSARSNDAPENKDYVDLPNGLITNSIASQMTIECWFTFNDTGNWSRVFDFGSSTDGEDTSRNGGQATYIMFTPKGGGQNAQVHVKARAKDGSSNVNYNINPGEGPVTIGQEHLVTVVHDEINTTLKMYLNGVLVAQRKDHGLVMAEHMIDNNMWIGRSQWNDAMFVGSVNELRMYDTALSAEEIVANYMAGSEEIGIDLEPITCDRGRLLDDNGDCFSDYADLALRIDELENTIEEKDEVLAEKDARIAELEALIPPSVEE